MQTPLRLECQANNIEVLVIPSHAFHIKQPLDGGINARIKQTMSQVFSVPIKCDISSYRRLLIKALKSADQQALDSEVIKELIYTFNPDFVKSITRDQTSTGFGRRSSPIRRTTGGSPSNMRRAFTMTPSPSIQRRFKMDDFQSEPLNFLCRGPFETEQAMLNAKAQVRTQAICQHFVKQFNEKRKGMNYRPIIFKDVFLIELDRGEKPLFI
ncbi:MAG: hypothetical protein EZS28_039956, partial [Streblomastix strix]